MDRSYAILIAFGLVLFMNAELSFAISEEADPPLSAAMAEPPVESAMAPGQDDMGWSEPPAVKVYVPEAPVYIFYLGDKKHDDPKVVTQRHLQILKSVLGSEKAANKSMVYSYHHGFSGFAAKVKPEEAKKLQNHPEVSMVLENQKLTMQGTRTWDYLGLSSTSKSKKSLLHKTNMGSDAIIGVIDSGIWPEAGVFEDNGFGAIPKRWRGECVSGDGMSSTDCNKKLIGAKYYVKGLNGDVEISINNTVDYLSPRDKIGHGTQVSSLAAGSFVSNLTYAGEIMRGGAPNARIAMYKTCWNVEGGVCSVADIWKAFDDAIHDNVDVLSVSIGSAVTKSLDLEIDIAIPALHAVNKGIPVVCPAGNGGSYSESVINVSPWILTVAATTIDRSFPTPITLGDNTKLQGQSVYTGPEIAFTDLIQYNESSVEETKGKVVLMFHERESSDVLAQLASDVQANDAIAIIFAMDPTDTPPKCPLNFPCLFVDMDAGTEIFFYYRTTSSPKIKFGPSKMITGKGIVTEVGKSSGRGPSAFSPSILKPDVAAPGVALLASRLATEDDPSEYAYSGTSMATPVIAGIVALLKISHPDWSPAAIKSAIATTAMRSDPHGESLISHGTSSTEADAFDYGSGLVNPQKATKPGLVYDMGINDYIHYLCSQASYTDSRVSALTGNPTKCPGPASSILDLNVPSITISSLKKNVTLTRTVTNVGPINSVYKPVIEAPMGFNIKVSPKKLVFNKKTKKIKYTVTVSTTHKVNTAYYFGSLTWTDGIRNVRIPVSLRTQIINDFYI